MPFNRFPVPLLPDTNGNPPGKLFPRDHTNGVFTLWDFHEKFTLDLPLGGVNQPNNQSRSEWVILINQGNKLTKPDVDVRILGGALDIDVVGTQAREGVVTLPWGRALLVAKEDNASGVVTAALLVDADSTAPGPGPGPGPGGLMQESVVAPFEDELKIGFLNVSNASTKNVLSIVDCEVGEVTVFMNSAYGTANMVQIISDIPMLRRGQKGFDVIVYVGEMIRLTRLTEGWMIEGTALELMN